MTGLLLSLGGDTGAVDLTSGSQAPGAGVDC